MITDLQKGSLTKRLSAFMLDFILVAMLAVGLALLLSWLLNYNSYFDTYFDRVDSYAQQYGVDFFASQEDKNAYTQEQQENYLAAEKAANSDPDIIYAYNMMISLGLTIFAGSIFLAFLLLEFLIPLKLGNGQTLGKKIFGIALMRTDGVKINGVSLFVRTLLGKYTVETMLPILVLILTVIGAMGLEGIIVVVGILVLQVVMMITSQTNAMIHDKLANTVVVDMQSQMIFGSELEQLAYKEKLHAEKAAKQEY